MKNTFEEYLEQTSSVKKEIINESSDYEFGNLSITEKQVNEDKTKDLYYYAKQRS